MPDTERIAAALRQIGRGFTALADAVAAEPDTSQDDRYAALMTEWGERGLTRAEISTLFRKHGFAPQAAGGWARGDWLETRDDGRRYLTARSRDWLREQS
jgi:hypothetical protein